MQILKNRPLALFGIFFAVCSVLAWYLLPSIKLLLAIIAFLSVILWIILSFTARSKRKLFLYGVSAFLGVCLSMFLSYLYFNCYYEDCQTEVGEEIDVEGIVLERVYSNSFSSGFAVRLQSINGEPSHEKIMLECEYPSALQCGDRFFVTAVQRSFAVEEGYNEETEYLSDGYTRILVCDSHEACEISSAKDRSLEVRLRQWNHTLSRKLRGAVGAEEGALAVALLLGNRSHLSESTALEFRRAGISHMLALSGMHIAVLIAFLDILLRKCRIPKIIRAVAVPIALIGYLLLTGMSVSTVRAVFMMCVLYLGFLLRADYDPFTALCAVLTAILLATPYAIFDLSLWMSFLASGSIIVFSPVIRSIGSKLRGEKDSGRIRRALAGLCEAVLVGVVANAALLLLTAFVFGELSLMSVPATVLLSLPMSVLLVFAMLSLLFAGAVPFVLLCRILSHFMLACTHFVSDIEHIMLSVGSALDIGFLILFTLALVLLAVAKIKPMFWYSAIPILTVGLFVLSMALTAAAPRRYDTPQETNGDFYALCEGGEMVVAAVGDGFSSDARAIADYAKTMRCTEIGDLVLVDYRNRQAYFVSEMARQIKIRNLRLPMPQTEREASIARRIVQEAELHGISVFFDIEMLCVSSAGDPYRWDIAPPAKR